MTKRTPEKTPYPRLLRRRGSPRPVIKGQDSGRWTDFYHQVLTAPWWLFILGLGGVFAFINAVFACLYHVRSRRPSSMRGPGSFWDAYLFSVETIGAVSYSAMLPKTAYANVIVAVEAFLRHPQYRAWPPASCSRASRARPRACCSATRP